MVLGVKHNLKLELVVKLINNMQVKYSNFSVITKLECPITENNFWKYPLYIYKEGRYQTGLSPRYFSLPEVEDIFSGDEEAACLAISNYAKTLRSVASNIQSIINK
jgi:hypothetical protein